MNDHAYDISHLLESELVKSDMPDLRITRTPPAAPSPSAVAVTQDAFVRELLKSAEVHEALIQQYLAVFGSSQEDTFGK